jgi:glycosyltransferase involved in cell wall biosynthesis
MVKRLSVFSYLKNVAPSWWSLIVSRRQKTRIAVLSTVWSHHAKRSGYHPVGKGLGVILPMHTMRLLPAALSQRIAGKGMAPAHEIVLAMKVAGCDRLLVIDGDFQLKLIEGIRRISAVRIVAVFHQIPSVLQRCLAQASPALLDGAVCVARCQMPLIRSIAREGHTWFVPHGVDADYFGPRAACSDQPVVLCVGWHYRDFDTLRKSADLICQAVPGVSVRLVAPPSLLPPGLKLGRVELLAGLSDEELLNEYRRAWVVLLPLTDSTANNSLLEAMACGTPVVVSDVGGVRDYVGADCGALCPPGDAQAHAAATIDLLRDTSRREGAGKAARARASICAWPIVREQIRQVVNSSTGRTEP